MSHHQTVKPLLGEVCVCPCVMVNAPATPSFPLAAAKDAAQAHPRPLVQRAEGRLQAVLEITKPADQRAVDIKNDAPQRFAGRTSGFLADRVLELVQALLSRPVFQTP